MDKPSAKEIIQWARADFERHRHETNIVSIYISNRLVKQLIPVQDNIKSLISSGKHQMHSLQNSVYLAQAGKR
jgi:hypothetical protein